MRLLRGTATVVAAFVLALVGLVGGVGWLYASYRGGLLALGPRVPGALALEALAGHAGQPLLRFAAAWLATGTAVGLIARAARLHRSVALPALALATALVLVAAGATSDALTANQRVVDHVLPQFSAAAPLGAWVALMAGAAAPLWPASAPTDTRTAPPRSRRSRTRAGRRPRAMARGRRRRGRSGRRTSRRS